MHTPIKIEFDFFDSQIPMLSLDTSGNYLQCNNATRKIFYDYYLSANTDINQDFDLFVRTKIKPQILEPIKHCIYSGDTFFDLDVCISEQQASPLSIRLLGEKQDSNYLVIVSNISSVKEREIDLIIAKETAEQAKESRTQFLANISHEIRTPIQTIIGMGELLQETHLDDEQTEYTRQVQFSASVMLSLVNDILDISKIEAGQLKTELIEFNLHEIIEQTVDLVSIEAFKKNLELIVDLDTDLPILVEGDPYRLQQVLLNLVKNAVKFTKKGSVLVQAQIVDNREQKEPLIQIKVIDTGIGVSNEAKEKLFNHFEQADSSTSRKFGGTGLGLAISKQIVELMQGLIMMEDNPKGGSIFSVQLPLKIIAPVEPEETIKLQDKRLLLVDDSSLLLSTLSKMLIAMGYTHITTSTNGLEALDKMILAQEIGKPFHLVFIDMIMPEMDGWRLAAEITKNKKINQARLCLMVPEGSFGGEAKMKLLEWFNDYIYKPVKKSKLQQLLQEQLETPIDLEVVDELIEPISTQESESTTIVDASEIRVLIAEDHPVNSKILSLFFEKSGATVQVAEDGVHATELMQAHSFDVIFMDIQMPRMNGYEAAEWIRKNGYTTPIIACTASANENEKEKCLSFGMNDILPKPFKKEKAIRMMVKYGQTQKELETIRAINDTLKAPSKSFLDQASKIRSQKIFNNIAFLDLVMNETDIAKSLIQDFLKQTNIQLKKLEQELLSESYKEASKTAHLIKGSSLNITATTVAQIASVIEIETKQGFLTHKQEYLDNLNKAFVDLVQILKNEGYV